MEKVNIPDYVHHLETQVKGLDIELTEAYEEIDELKDWKNAFFSINDSLQDSYKVIEMLRAEIRVLKDFLREKNENKTSRPDCK